MRRLLDWLNLLPLSNQFLTEESGNNNEEDTFDPPIELFNLNGNLEYKPDAPPTVNLTVPDEEEPPRYVENDEIVIRAIFSPDNIRANNTLKSNTFKGPPEKDEVSVDRLQYTTEEKCEENGRKIAEESAKKTFIGFAYVKAEAIRNAEADVIGTPRKIAPINLAHADIKIGFIRERGKELPAEYQLIVDEITKASTVKIINN